MAIKLDTNTAIQRIKNKCKEKNYEFLGFCDKEGNETDYQNNQTHLKLHCNICGNDWHSTTYARFLKNNGCPECKRIKNKEDVKRMFTKEIIEKRRMSRTISLTSFLEKAALVRNDLDNYDWHNVDLTKRDKDGRVTFYCKKHGAFQIRLTHFLEGVQGCKYCNGREINEEDTKIQLSKIHPTLDFSKATFEKHEDGYLYVSYVCPLHGNKTSRLHNLLHGEGCRLCATQQVFGISKLEKETENFLKEHNIEYEREKGFQWLKFKKGMFLDFYLPQYNTAIECQGKQHYESVEHFGGKANFKLTQERDKTKFKLCKEHGIDIFYFANFKTEDYFDDLNELLAKIKQKEE